MKKIIYLLLLLPLAIPAQTSQLTPLQVFHNTNWEWTDGTNTFTVTLLDSDFERNKPLEGLTFFLTYKMVDNSGNTIYETRPSVISYDGSLPFGGILTAYDETPSMLYGQIDDFSHPNNEYGIQAMLKIVYIPCQGTGCSPQISWKISKPVEIVVDPSAPDDYNLPKDIILTKVN
jgi:hypothetical protein